MFSPGKAITVAALVIGGVMLIGQPFDQRGSVLGAAIDDPGPDRPGVGQDTAFVEHLQRDPDWLLHESDRYGYIVGYPPSWTVRTAEREWTYEADATDRSSPATEDLNAPDVAVTVAVMSLGVVGDERAVVMLSDSSSVASLRTPAAGLSLRPPPSSHHHRPGGQGGPSSPR